jgi:hypothetical protein
LEKPGAKARLRNAQGIEAEIPQIPAAGGVEELERIARFPALRAGNAPYLDFLDNPEIHH